jgi:ActR/RegA family two-component response regulator/GGDEF domain-containing protein
LGGLQVVAIVADPEAAALLGRATQSVGDSLSIVESLADGLARVSVEVPDVALVDVAIGQNAGLAVVHHIRALAPGVPIYALTPEKRLDLGNQAMALGATGVLVMPLTGDDVLTTLGDVRARRAERDRYREIEARVRSSHIESSLFVRVAELADCETRREAAERLLAALGEAGARRGLVYLPAGDGARQLVRGAALPRDLESPSFCEELELLGFAERQGLEVVRMALRRETGGILLADGVLNGLPAETRESLLGALGVQAATLFALIGAREEARRGGMKDPLSSAYTFAYFVDVAGREIDMARRHRRRFSLTTIGVHAQGEARPDEPEPTLATVEHVLGAVRDTDVLARVDANEFYLLLPETGGLGAHSCRRRVLDRLGAAPGAERREVGVGVAAYPHDGGDLSRLLRIARHRAEVCRVSVVERLGLRKLSLPEIVDALLAEPAGVVPVNPLLDVPRAIELPMTDIVSLVQAAMREALRGGSVLAALTRHAGVGIGGTLTGEASPAGPRQIHAVDVSTLPGCANIEICALVAEHGAYALVGRSEGHSVRAVHAADPLLADLLIQRLSQASGARWSD